jgi:hypothetical protein
MTFSQRMKLVPVREAIQVESLDIETRNALWNLISPMLSKAYDFAGSTLNLDIWVDLYCQTSDSVPNTRRNYEYNVSESELFYRFYKKKVLEGEWYECLDLMEYIAQDENRKRWCNQCYDLYSERSAIFVPGAKNFNMVFEKFMVGYRFVNGEITPIANNAEIQSIEDAIEKAKPSVQELLSKALKHLSNRTHPDYAKSVECAISAVESQCCIILGRDNATLGDAIKQFERQGMKLHSALKDAFHKLYGFASNEAGIRHGTIKPSDVDQSLAKFMLVTCSAFVNYLIENSQCYKS